MGKKLKSDKPCTLFGAFKEILSPLGKNPAIESFVSALGLRKDDKYYQRQIAEELKKTNELLAEQNKYLGK